MNTTVKLLLIWCVIFLESPDRFSWLWWLIIFTFVLNIIDDIRSIIKLRRDE